MSQRGKVHNFTNPQEDYNNSFDWEAVGAINDVGTALSAANLAAATAEAIADTLCFQPSFGTVGLEFRFYTEDGAGDFINNETYTMNVYGRVGTDDYYTKIGVLTLTVGLGQKGNATTLWVDKIAIDSVDLWLTTTKVTSPDDGTIAKFVMNAHGYRSILFQGIAGGTSEDTANVNIEARRF